MSIFDAVVDAMLEGRTVYAATLLYADFDTSPARFWFGPYTLKTNDGNEWNGGGRLLSIDLLSPAIGTTAQPATIRLSGVDPDRISQFVDNIDSAVERDVVAYVQFFGDGDLAGRYKPLGNPVAIGGWISDQLTFDKQQGGQTYTLSLSLESYFVGRSRSPSSYYSYTEQNDRAIAMGYPGGDKGCQFMTALQNKKINFPDF